MTVITKLNMPRHIDRSTWGLGPWDDEPDRVEFEHAGLPYADACRGSICHVPQPGEPDNVWWFGFDCGHVGDVIPALPQVTEWTDDSRDMAYVRAETTRLAEQLAAKTPRTGGEAEQP